MGRKSNTSFELKIATIEAYERNEGSIKTISEYFRVSARTLRDWIQIYRSQGKEGLLPSNTNKHWSKDVKLLVVQEYLSGGGSLQDICRKHKISSTSILRNWIKVYNSHKELTSTGTGGRKPMIKARKKTFEERIFMVSDTLNGVDEKYANFILLYDNTITKKYILILFPYILFIVYCPKSTCPSYPGFTSSRIAPVLLGFK